MTTLWRVLSCCLLLVGATNSVEARPWHRDAGEQFNRSELDAFWSDDDGHHFRQLTARDYLELGFGERLTAGGQLATVIQEAHGPGYLHQREGIAEADLFIIWHDDIDGQAVSGWQMSGGLPTAKFDQNGRVLGQDSYVGLARLFGVGHNWFFATASLGGRASLGNDAHQVRVDTSLGLKFREALFLAKMFNTVSVSEAQPSGTDFDLGQASVSAVLPLRKRTKLEVGARMDLYARSITPGRSLFFAVWLTL